MPRLLLVAALAHCVVGTLPRFDGSRHLWYSSPAPAMQWELGSLPIGNGRLGATIFGGGDEVLTLNEDSIWSGPLQDRTPSNGPQALLHVRDLLVAGDLTDGSIQSLANLSRPDMSMRMFSYFGNMNLAFGHRNNLQNYTRWLDTTQGNSGVEYSYNGVDFTREYIASHPAGVLAARFTSSRTGLLDLNITLSRADSISANDASTVDGLNTITMRGSSGQALDQGPILFTGQARFVAPGASITAQEGVLSIRGGTTVDMFFDAESNYRFPDDQARENEVTRKLDAATKLGFDRVRNDAIADASSLLKRASVDLGPSPNGLANLATDQRVANARTNSNDIQLVTLVWNYGRHLLVAASRRTDASNIDLPANLQGIWNNETTAPWGGKWTININTEMNYWPAGPTNIVETQEPLFDLMVKVAGPRGMKLAKDLYGCGGVVFHHNLDIWGDPAPTDNYPFSTMWPMGAAWLVQHMLEHYRFTGDKEFLKNTAYPFLVEVASFYQCYAFDWQGFRVTGPSLSPENGFFVPANMTVAGAILGIDIAIEMDNQLMRDVMAGLLEAGKELGLSDSDTEMEAAKEFLAAIREPQIGSAGQILEWKYEYQETEWGHRHLSPLYGLHPSSQFSPLINETLGKAAKVLLDRRLHGGSGGTGWSMTWLINQYTRAFDASTAWSLVWSWFAKYPMANLWNSDSGSRFQIDGNFGFTSAITEMILQSHANVVHILPSLPFDAIASGRARGLMARGGFELDIQWEGGRFKSATAFSTRGGDLSIRITDGEAFLVNGKPYNGHFKTEEGMTYMIQAVL